MERPLIFSKEFAELLGIGTIDLPNGYQLATTSMQIFSETGCPVGIKAEFLVRGPEVKLANTDSAGGYVVPVELEDAVRTGLDIVQQPRAVLLEPDLSDWIDGSVKPTIEGVYERDVSPTSRVIPAYSLWDGFGWHSMHHDVRKAYRERALSSCQNAPWRGLRHDPARSEGHTS